MPDRYRKQSAEVTAHRWWKHGDGPADREGRVVRYFHRPDVPGDTHCRYCGERAHAHGWIDTPGGGQSVCPGDWIITDERGGYRRCKADEMAEATRRAASFVDETDGGRDA